MKAYVRIVVDKQLKGYSSYDEDEWIKEKNYIGTNMQDIITQVNKDLNIIDIHSAIIDSTYATYKSKVNSINFTIEID